MIKSNKERQAPTSVKDAEPSHLARYEFTRSLVEGEDKVLDLPCGSGYGSALLSGSAKQVIGVDIDQGAIDHAKEFFSLKNNQFIVGDMERLDQFSENQFDAVVSFEGVEHIWNQKGFLEEVKRVLRPEGFLVISTPCKPHGSPHHTIEFNLDEFRDLLEKEFVVEDLFGQIFTDIFNMKDRKEDPEAYHRFNFIAICRIP